jgi:hypothetical protein
MYSISVFFYGSCTKATFNEFLNQIITVAARTPTEKKLIVKFREYIKQDIFSSSVQILLNRDGIIPSVKIDHFLGTTFSTWRCRGAAMVSSSGVCVGGGGMVKR